MWVGWGLWPLIVPIGVDVFFCCFCCFCCSDHTLATGWVFWVHSCVLHAFFGALMCVWNVFFLSNIVNYRKNLYSSTNCNFEIASPTLVENPHSLHGSQENCYPVAQKIVASLRTRGSIDLPVKE